VVVSASIDPGSADAHDQVEGVAALQDLRDGQAAERRGDDVGDLLDGQAVAGDRVAIQADLHDRDVHLLLDG
jgi:hypothetical protein